MNVYYQNKLYSGNISEVFQKIWNDRKGTPIYSDNEQAFLRNMFRGMAMHIVTVKETNVLNSQIKEKRDATQIEKKEIEKTIDMTPLFLEKLEKKGFLQPIYLLAFGKITHTMQINIANDEERYEIDGAKQNLMQIVPDNLISI